jgi:hypothetical protein
MTLTGWRTTARPSAPNTVPPEAWGPGQIGHGLHSRGT